MSCPVVVHPDRTSPSPRPKALASRTRRSRNGVSPVMPRESPRQMPDWGIGFEQISRNLEHHIHQSKQDAETRQSLPSLADPAEEKESARSVKSVESWESDVEMIAEAFVTVVQKEINIMRDRIIEESADHKIWFENAFSEMKALQLRVLDDLQCFRATHNTNQETHLTPILRGTASSEPEPVAAQCIGNVQMFGASQEDRKLETQPFNSMQSQLDVDSTSLATDGLQKDKTNAFIRIASIATHKKKHEIQEAHAHKHRVREVMSYLTPTQSANNCLSHIPDEPPNESLTGFVQGGLFNSIVSLALVLNSIFIGMDVNDDMRRAVHNEDEQDPFFENMNTCFTIFFTIELILRVIGLRSWFILGSEKAWNLFDTVLVVLSLIDVVLGERTGNLIFMRILKIFRLTRILRIIRLLQFFKELQRIVMSILASLQALTWAVLLILLVMYVFSTVLMRAGADYLSESGTSSDRRLWKQFYGSITTSMYMLLQCVSGGQDWGLMVEPLEMLSEVYKILFVFFIIFIVFGLLNVLTGVFIGTAGEVMDRDVITQAEIFKERRFVKEMKMIVRKLLGDKLEEITWHQFCSLTEKPETQTFLAANGLGASDMHLLFGLCAGSTDATKLCTEDLATGCHRLKGPANQLQIEALMIELESIHWFLHVNFTSVLKFLRPATTETSM